MAASFIVELDKETINFDSAQDFFEWSAQHQDIELETIASLFHVGIYHFKQIKQKPNPLNYC